MESVYSTLKFVSAGFEHSQTGTSGTAQTGDFFGIVFILVALICSFCICLLIVKNRQYVKTNSCMHAKVTKSYSWIKPGSKSLKIAFIVSIAGLLISCLYFAIFSPFKAQAQNTNFVTNQGIETPECINAKVYEDSGNIKEIENPYLKSNTDKYQLVKEFDFSSLADVHNAKWQLKYNTTSVYDGLSDGSMLAPNGIYVSPSGKIDFTLSTNLDSSTAKSLIGQDVLKIGYKTAPAAALTGCLKDFDGNSIAEAKVSLCNEDGSVIYESKTNDDGSFILVADLNKNIFVKIQAQDYEERSTAVVKADKDIDLGTIQTCYQKKASIPKQKPASQLIYNGKEIVGFDNVDDTVVATGIYKAKDCGDYQVSFMPADKHSWPDGTRQPQHHNWSISKIDLKIKLEDQSVQYGTDISDGKNLQITYDGFVPGETKEVLDGSIVVESGYTPQTEASDTPIETSIAKSSLSSKNYNISYINEGKANIVVVKRYIELAWGQTTWVYDGKEHKTSCDASNLVNGDIINITYTDKGITNAADGPVRIEATSFSGDKANNYCFNPDDKRFVEISIEKALPKLQVNDAIIGLTDTVYWSAEYSGDSKAKPSFVVQDQNFISVSEDPQGSNTDFIIVSKGVFGKSAVTIDIPEGDNYKAAQTTFNVKSANLVGGVESVKNIVDEKGQPKLALQDGVLVELFTTQSGQEVQIGQSVSDRNAIYRFVLDDKYTGQAVNCKVRINGPGVGPFEMDVVLNTESSTSKDLKINGLDFYTIEELTQASDILGSNPHGNQALYDEFLTYLNTDQIWYSNSNGKQDKSVKDDISTVDPAKCNQNYKNKFVIDESKIVPEHQNLDQFMFLRIIDLCHDIECFSDGSPTGKVAGLTVQTVRSLPRAYPMCGHADVKWWGDENSFIRKDLSENGEIISNLNSNIKNSILTVQKKTQKTFDSTSLDIKNTADKMFMLSYTEMCTPGTEDEDFASFAYYKDEAEGKQYKWYKNHNIQGNNIENADIAELCNVNSGEEIAEGNARTFQRTTYYDAQANFLTTNYRGSIRTYAQSKQRVGIAPAFCLGTPSATCHLRFLGDNVDFIDKDGNKIESGIDVLKDTNFVFKINVHEGQTLAKVSVDGLEVLPDADGNYHVNNITGPRTISARTQGEPNPPVFTGQVKFEKNIGSDKSYQDIQSSVNVKLLDENNQFVASCDTLNGVYNIELGSSMVGKKFKLVVDARAGIDAYSSDLIETVEDKNLHDINLHALDAYTLTELKDVATWLGNNAEKLESDCYKEFDSYLTNDVVWYSNSNGQQPSNVSIDQTNRVDVSKCNKEYVNSFIMKDGKPDLDNVDNYLFLRVIGTNHDTKEDGKSYAGLTFQSIHVLPNAYTMSSGSKQWWGNSYLRSLLQEGGDVYSQINQSIRDKVVKVNKQSQTIRQESPSIETTKDAFFVTSYSEMWNINGSLVGEHPWYDNTGINTEGYVYGWYKAHKINGGTGNDLLKTLPLKNSGVAPSEKLTSWERSVCCADGDSYFMATDGMGSLLSNNFNFGATGFAICFCL